MNTPLRGTCCILISSAWCASSGSSHRVTGDRRDGVKGIGAEFLHVAVDDHSRAGLHRHVPGPDRAQFHPLPRRCGRLVRLPRHRHPPRAHLTTAHAIRPTASRRACDRLNLKHRRTRPTIPTDQRKGRTLHPNRHQRMGTLRSHLPELRRQNFLAAPLDPPVQLAPSPCQPQPTATHQQSRSR